MNIPQAMARAARCAVRIMTAGALEPSPSRWRWPPLDGAPTAARIHGERAGARLTTVPNSDAEPKPEQGPGFTNAEAVELAEHDAQATSGE